MLSPAGVREKYLKLPPHTEILPLVDSYFRHFRESFYIVSLVITGVEGKGYGQTTSPRSYTSRPSERRFGGRFLFRTRLALAYCCTWYVPSASSSLLSKN